MTTFLVQVCCLQLLIVAANPQTQVQPRVLTHPEVKVLPKREKRWALIIGIDDYDKDVSPLKGAVNDAKALRDVLIQQAGFPEGNVILLTTDASSRDQLPTRTNILEELDNLSDRIPSDGLLLFSFSGHGVSIGSDAYLIPSDGRITKNPKLLRDFSIDVQRIKEAIEESKIKQVLMFLDACRNEPGKGEAPNAFTEAYKHGFSFDVANSGVTAFATLFAASVGERAYEFLDRDTRRYRGYFSFAVEEALKGKAANSEGEITLSGLTEYVDRWVPERVKSAKGESQQPFNEISGFKANELILAIEAPNNSSSVSSLSKPSTEIDPTEVEREYWEAIRSSNDTKDYDGYLEAYPKGAYAGVARAKIRQLAAARKTEPSISSKSNEAPSTVDSNGASQPTAVPNTAFTTKVNVRADNTSNGWTNSGLVIRRGQQVHISASGRVSLGSGRISTPIGLLGVADLQKLMLREPTGGLIAVIGDDNDDFIFIGAGREFTAQRDGVLFLGVNEGNLTDNSGSYNAVIESQLLNIAGSTSHPVNNEPSPRPITIEVSVRADDVKNGWTNSGFVARRGQQIRISATGRVSLGKGRFSTPAGLPGVGDSNKLIHDQPTGGLIAVIGDDNDDFIFIGAQHEFIAQRDGVLFLGVNEGNLTDNSGSFDAVIEPQLGPSASSTPEPVNKVRSEINVSVRADNVNNGWTNSGLVVRRGQQIRISASGQVSLGKGRFSTPVGLPGLVDLNKLMRNYPTGGLIAVIGDDNDDFIFIGGEREFTAQHDGVVFLGVNEGDLTDNFGSYDAAVQVLTNSQPTDSGIGGEESTALIKKEVNVRADAVSNGWTNSGLIVRRGQHVHVSASGRVSLGKGRFSSPTGLPGVFDVDKLMHNYPTGGLIAVIGDDNDDFIFIGSDGDFTAARDGVLFLGVNEGNLNDNSGSYNVVVSVGLSN